MLFLYTINEYSEKETMKAILFRIASKTIRNLGKYLTREVQDLYAGKYKTLLEKNKDLNKLTRLHFP